MSKNKKSVNSNVIVNSNIDASVQNNLLNIFANVGRKGRNGQFDNFASKIDFESYINNLDNEVLKNNLKNNCFVGGARSFQVDKKLKYVKFVKNVIKTFECDNAKYTLRSQIHYVYDIKNNILTNCGQHICQPDAKQGQSYIDKLCSLVGVLEDELKNQCKNTLDEVNAKIDEVINAIK